MSEKEFDLDIDTSFIDDALEKVSGKLRNMKPLMADIAGDLLSQLDKTFREEGANGPGGRWAELSEVTKAKRGTDGKILHDGGDLEGAKDSDYGADFAEAGFAGTDDEESTDFALLAAVHHDGTTEAGRNKDIEIPAREIFFFDDEYQEKIPETVLSYLD